MLFFWKIYLRGFISIRQARLASLLKVIWLHFERVFEARFLYINGEANFDPKLLSSEIANEPILLVDQSSLPSHSWLLVTTIVDASTQRPHYPSLEQAGNPFYRKLGNDQNPRTTYLEARLSNCGPALFLQSLFDLK